MVHCPLESVPIVGNNSVFLANPSPSRQFNAQQNRIPIVRNQLRLAGERDSETNKARGILPNRLWGSIRSVNLCACTEQRMG